MKKFLILLFVPLLSNAHTLERFFKNGGNPDIDGNLVVASFHLQSLEEPRVARHLKYLIFLDKVQERVRDLKVLQLNYGTNGMAKGPLQDVFFEPNMNQKLARAQDSEFVNTERDFFYSLLLSLLANSEKAMVGVLKKNQVGFLSNDEVINQDKYALLKRYRNYLESIKDEPSLKEQMISPLAPDDMEERKRVRGLMKESFYGSDENIKLEKMGTELFYLFETDELVARFRNTDHRLKNLIYRLGDKSFEVQLGGEIILNGKHRLPQDILIKTFSGRRFSLRPISLSHLNKDNYFFRKRIRYYRDELAKRATAKIPKIEFLY